MVDHLKTVGILAAIAAFLFLCLITQGVAFGVAVAIFVVTIVYLVIYGCISGKGPFGYE